MWTLRFDGGSLVVEGATAGELPPGFLDDDRIGHPRGPAWRYADVVLGLRAKGVSYEDRAKGWKPLDDLEMRATRTPRPYQTAALAAWEAAGRRGAVILPTGSGKTLVAELAIASTRRPVLVVAPTLDLVGQWHDRLFATFGRSVGIVAGGHHDPQDLTVTTYDSAYLHLPRLGDRFGLIVFDEVHHLPAQAYLQAAECAMAPFRLGLTATWEREDGLEALLGAVLGPVVYRREITELSGEYLADYDTVRLEVKLTGDERRRYDDARAIYSSFIGRHRIPIRSPNGWQVFIQQAARSKEGRAAFKAYQESRKIAHGAEGKLDTLQTLLDEERGRPTIVFTHDNATAYRVSREFLVPCITHQTDVKERRKWLEEFEAGRLPVLATSRVLNEGIDLPAAEVAVVLSGTGTVREHVQRLGRILRPGPGKRAVLYEVVAADTTEKQASQRRRRHVAYR